MSLYEIGLIGSALFAALGLLALLSMVTEAGSWRVLFGCVLIGGLFYGLAHVSSDAGVDLDDLSPAVAKAVEMVRGPRE